MIRWFSKVVFKCNLIRKIKLRNSPLLNFQWMSKNLKNQMFSDVTIQSHPNIKSVLFNERKETHKHVNLHRERDGGRGKKQNWKTTLPFARCYSDSDAMTKLLSWQFIWFVSDLALFLVLWAEILLSRIKVRPPVFSIKVDGWGRCFSWLWHVCYRNMYEKKQSVFFNTNQVQYSWENKVISKNIHQDTAH